MIIIELLVALIVAAVVCFVAIGVLLAFKKPEMRPGALLLLALVILTALVYRWLFS